jgi:hypothetical protein
MAKKVKLVPNAPADKGSDINSNLGRAKNETTNTHTIRTKTHPFAEHIEKNRGLMHVVNSGDYKAYRDTIDTRIRKKIAGKYNGNINAPVAGRGGAFSGYQGNELLKHYVGNDMDKNHENPNYNKTVYYGKMSHPDKGYFEGVYKTEEHFPHKETEVNEPDKKQEVKKTSPKYTIPKKAVHATPFDMGMH